MKAWQEDANNGQIIIGVYNSATTGGGGHIIMLVPGTALEVESGDWAILKYLPMKLECGADVKKSSSASLKLNMSFDKTFKEMIWYKYIGTKKQ